MQLKKVYEEIADAWSNFRTKPKKSIPFNKINGFVLDVGCGNARNIIPLAKKGLKCVGIDFAKNMIKNALNLCKKNNVKVDFVIADMLYLPFKNKTFDTCLCIATLHHLDSRLKRILALKEMKRVCKNEIYITVWYRWQLFHLVNLLKNFRHFGDVYVEWKRKDKILKRYYHLYTKAELEKDLKKAELEICEIKVVSENKKKDVFAFCKVS
ncbi:MAG: class I SAM-dependent methyltransferase [Candidatus Aenigmarchaeota archaeon]|nr:class I SAM-dependent methyltransferase [Candidatus Aenigmarchaeota archaeon]